MQLVIALLAGALLAASPDQSSPQPGSDPAFEDMVRERLGEPSEADVARRVQAAENEPLGSAANPVRAHGPRGQQAYIARLRCADGSRPRVGTRSNVGVGAFGFIVDVYPLTCAGDAPLRLHMDMYHSRHRESRPPAGFTIAPEGGSVDPRQAT